MILQVKLPRRMRLRMSWRTPRVLVDGRGLDYPGVLHHIANRENKAPEPTRDSTEIHKNAETFAEKTKVLADV